MQIIHPLAQEHLDLIERIHAAGRCTHYSIDADSTPGILVDIHIDGDLEPSFGASFQSWGQFSLFLDRVA
ncbi:hypothetical protein VI06_11650 [Aquitalea magnusonii]|nr:hypothetical protein VI06_11650 [Aquitalea magnusonii]